jgi:putative endonuclease
MLLRFLPSRELGRRGEQYAAWFYRLRGFRVVSRNVRMRDGELDLIVRRGGTLVFVEVKARASVAAGEGSDAVTREKQSRIARLAGRWLTQHPHEGEIRYDVLSLHWTGLRFVATQFANAFQTVTTGLRFANAS